MTPRSRLVAGLACLIAVWAAGHAQAAAPRPNVLVIVSDDQGYVDAGFQGGTDVPTPHLDRLAASGVRCTSGYVSHPFCSPTRAGLLTGRYQARFGHENNPVYDPLDPAEGLPLGEQILPQLLQPAGYANGWVGKWHLGASPAHTPWARGFDDTFGFIGGGHRFLGWKPDGRQYTLPLVRLGQPVDDVPAHLTAAFGDEAAAFVRRHAGHPWFLYLAFNAPHTPHEPTAEREARFAHVADPQRRKYLAQVSLLDDAIGSVTRAIADSGQAGRTLVFFCSDNGGPVKNAAVNGPLRGGKGQLYEGGIRVPFIVSWPDRLPAGATYDQPVSSLDVFATALAAAGVPHPRDKPYDGVDLVPYLTGTVKAAPHERLFWRLAYGRGHAVREGRWKLVRSKDKPDELYDLDADLAEATDLALHKPAIASRLAAAVDAWSTELVDPVFPGSSAKSEDWGPGGANQTGNPKALKRRQDAANAGAAATRPAVVAERSPPQRILPAGWDPVQAADRVLAGLIRVTPPEVKGAHDAEMAIVGRRAYVVAEVNDVRPGEGAGWPEIYSAMAVVDLDQLAVERFVPFARGGQRFDNATLPEGSCFVPRIIRKDDATLRCFFATEHPGKGESQVWFIDHDLATGRFATTVHKAQLTTAAGTFDMQPGPFHADAVAQGFRKPARDHGFYIFDSFKRFDGKTYVALNNYPGGQNALALLDAACETFTVVGHYNEPQSLQISESAVNRLPDGTWMAICRQDGGTRNYTFTTSRDGRAWTEGKHLPVVANGTNSKPTFDRFGGVYHLGWQEATQVDGVSRSVFNVDISRDGEHWERTYRFQTRDSFQYPTFREHEGTIWLCVTQGDADPSRKERIMFGRLEPQASAPPRAPVDIQAVVDAAVRRGETAVTLPAGEHVLPRGLVLRGVGPLRITGAEGRTTVLRLPPMEFAETAADATPGERRLPTKRSRGLTAGMKLWIEAAGEIDSFTKRQKPFQRAVVESVAADAVVLTAPLAFPVPAGTLVRNDDAPNLVAIGEGCRDIAIEDLTLEGGKLPDDPPIRGHATRCGIFAQAPYTYEGGVKQDRVAGVVVRRCTIRHCHGRGAAFYAVADPVVEECRIEDTSDEAVDLDHFTIRGRVVDNRIERCLVGVELNDANDCLVQDNRFIACGIGINLWRWCTMPDLDQRNRIVRNRFHDTRGNGMQIGEGTGPTSIDENEILRSGSNGISVAGQIESLRDNVIRDSAKQDIARRE